MRMTASCITAALLLSVSLLAQQSGGSKIILDHADTLRSRAGARELIGHVRIHRGATRIRAERALHRPLDGSITLTGKVQLSEPERTLNALRLDFYEQSGDFEARGQVDLTQGDSVRIRCDRAKYTESIGRLDLYDNVIIDDLKEGSQITGGRGWWLEAEDAAVIEMDPVYSLPGTESDSLDTLFIESGQLTLFRITNSAMFVGKVRIKQGDLHGFADTLEHNPDSSLTVMTGSPVLWKDNEELSGNRIEIYYEGRKVDHTVVVGDAVALSQQYENDIRRNRMTGDRLTIISVDDTTRLVRIEGKAKAWYHVWDEDDRYQGVNHSAADMMELNIIKQTATDILMEGRANGTFYPPDLVPMENPASGSRR